MRLLWLLAIQLPPQEAAPELLAFLTETLSSMTLSDTVATNMPLKQLWCDVTCLTVAFVLIPRVPWMKIPCRRNFCTMPGPKTLECVSVCAWATFEMRMPSAEGGPGVALQNPG